MTLATTNAVRSLRRDPHDRPFIVIWEVTRACQLACHHCRANAVAERDPAELDTAEGRALLDDIAAWEAPRPMVVLTGGDPFERPDLTELVAHGTRIGLHMAVSPSVTPRLTRATLADLGAAGTRAISLSLDGATPAAHDAFRGIDGVFDATIDAARRVRELGMRLQLNTTVTRRNVGQLPDILARVLLADVSLWSVFFLVPTGRGALLDPLVATEVEEVLHWLHDIAPMVPVKATEAPHFRRVAVQRRDDAREGRTSPMGPLRSQLAARTAELATVTGSVAIRRPRPPLDVNAGRGFAFVDHTGAVYPSGFLPVVVGRVREQTFRSIYRESPLLRSLRDPSQLHGRCGACDYRDICGGSRSRAHATTGDLLGEDPSCVHQPPGYRPESS